MMTYSIAFLYGLIQGLTEFLPVSSSGHLALIPYFMRVSDPGVFFDLSMHLGTALAVGLYFKNDLLTLLKAFLSIVKNKKISTQSEKAFLHFTLVTLVTGLLGLILKDFGKALRSPLFIGVNLGLFGVLYGVADSWAKKRGERSGLSVKSSFLLGLFQALAVFPGVSRSGITLTCSRFLGLSRKESGRFSFLLSFPLILAGMALHTLQAINGDATGVYNWEVGHLLMGTTVSFVIGLMSIHLFLKCVEFLGPWPFVAYRVILAGILIALSF